MNLSILYQAGKRVLFLILETPFFCLHYRLQSVCIIIIITTTNNNNVCLSATEFFQLRTIIKSKEISWKLQFFSIAKGSFSIKLPSILTSLSHLPPSLLAASQEQYIQHLYVMEQEHPQALADLLPVAFRPMLTLSNGYQQTFRPFSSGSTFFFF